MGVLPLWWESLYLERWSLHCDRVLWKVLWVGRKHVTHFHLQHVCNVTCSCHLVQSCDDVVIQKLGLSYDAGKVLSEMIGCMGWCKLHWLWDHVVKFYQLCLLARSNTLLLIDSSFCKLYEIPPEQFISPFINYPRAFSLTSCFLNP